MTVGDTLSITLIKMACVHQDGFVVRDSLSEKRATLRTATILVSFTMPQRILFHQQLLTLEAQILLIII